MDIFGRKRIKKLQEEKEMLWQSYCRMAEDFLKLRNQQTNFQNLSPDVKGFIARLKTFNKRRTCGPSGCGWYYMIPAVELDGVQTGETVVYETPPQYKVVYDPIQSTGDPTYSKDVTTNDPVYPGLPTSNDPDEFVDAEPPQPYRSMTGIPLKTSEL